MPTEETNGTEEARLREKVERLQEENDDLRERIGALEEFVNKELLEEEGIKNLGAVVYNHQDKIDDLESERERSDYEPSTKIEKLQKLLHEHWEGFSCDGCVQTRKRKNRRGNVKNESVNKQLNDALRKKYDEECQAVQVHDAMKRLGERDGYEYEEKDGYKELRRER